MKDLLKKLFRIGLYSRRDHVSALFADLKRYGVEIRSADALAARLREAGDWRSELVLLAQRGREVGIQIVKKSGVPLTADILTTVLVRNGFEQDQAETISNNLAGC